MRFPLVWVLAASCVEFRFDPTDPEEAPRSITSTAELFVQAASPAVDLLLVVDDTASMEHEQEVLSAAFPDLIDLLDDADVSWQIGIVSTDMQPQDAGWLRGAPYVLTPSHPDPRGSLAERVRVGTGGAAPEAGLAAAALALELTASDAVNAGFRRPDAVLYTVFVSDADDKSETWLGDDPVAAFAAVMEAQSGPDRPARAFAIVGDVPGGCTSDTSTAQAGTRYAELVDDDSALASICAPDFDGIVQALSDVAAPLQSEFGLRYDPMEGSVHVNVDGEPNDDWTLLGGNVVVFDPPPPPASSIEIAYLVFGGEA
jgi:hypothetical protein